MVDGPVRDESGAMDNAVPPPPAPGPSQPGPGDQPGPPPGHDGGPRVTTAEMKDLGRLRRSVTDRHVAGVAGGLARHLDVDPILVRVAFVIGAFFGGAGLLLYFAAWLFVPEEGSQEQPLGLDERSRVAVLVIAAALALLAAVGDWAGAYWFPWPIALLALGVLWFVQRDRRTRTWAPYAGPAPTAGPATDPATGGQPYPHDLTAPGAPIPPIDYSRLRPQNPRKRGPVLFWFTLALIALAEGTLLVVDLAGVGVLPSAYPALALAITAAMLLLGAFWGRAGGLILVALLAAGATWATAASEQWESQTLRYAPQQASEVRDTYELHGGQLVLDLSQVEDPEALAGREVRVDAGAGQVEVIVPTGLDVLANTDVGVGSLTVFGDQSEGLGINRTGSHTGDDSTVDLTVDIDLGVGEVVVRTQGGMR